MRKYLVLTGWNLQNPVYKSLSEMAAALPSDAEYCVVDFCIGANQDAANELRAAIVAAGRKVVDSVFLRFNETPNVKSWRSYAAGVIPQLGRIDGIYSLGGPFFRNKDDRAKASEALDRGVFEFRAQFISAMVRNAIECCGSELKTLVYDPEENSYASVIPGIRETRYHGYEFEPGVERLDSMQLAMDLHYSYLGGLDATNRTYGISFGFTALNEARHLEYIELRKSINIAQVRRPGDSTGGRSNFIVARNPFVGEDRFVSRPEYLSKLADSMFTLVIKPYGGREFFSPYRFIEAVWLGAIPLTHVDCNWKGFAKSFGIPCMFFENELLVTYADVGAKMQSLTNTRHRNIIKQLREYIFGNMKTTW